MTHPHVSRRIRSAITLGIFSLGILLPVGTAIAAEEPRFELRPHCSSEDIAKKACKSFAVRDAQSFQTSALKIGDTLDIDLIIHNPGNAAISRFSTWMGYDPTVFTGSKIEINATNFPTVDQKNVSFSTSDGYIKASGASATGAKGTEIIAARVVMKVISAPIGSTVISFYDSSKKVTSKSAIIVKVNSQEQNIASVTQSYLYVRLDTAFSSAPASSSATSAAASSASTLSSSPVSGSGSSSSATQNTTSSSMESSSAVSSGTGTSVSSAASSVPANVAFTLLQVQGLRVTTDGSSAFLAWNQLNAGNLLGYNVYYGTVSGKYIQRRSVEKTSTTLTIRSLPVGTQYFFAVRGVDANNQESDFSQEVAVTIGNPSTSTSPLTGNVSDLGPGGKTPGTGGKVAGDTGPASTMLLLVALSSVAGLLLAFRRQFTAKHISI